MTEIEKNEMLLRLSQDDKQEYLDICAGRKLPSLMSDIIAKRIFDPDNHSERLEWLLRKITSDDSIKVSGSFKNESGARFTGAKKIIFDIPAVLDDERYSDTDFQVHAQDFAFKRGELYGSDLLTIQYSVSNGEKKSQFSYENAKGVILVFLLKESPKELREYDAESEKYIHRFGEYYADSGFHYTPMLSTTYVQVDKAFKQFKEGKDAQNDLDLQLLLAMMSDINDEDVLNSIRANTFLDTIVQEVRELSMDKEVQAMLLAEKYALADLNAVKSYERNEGETKGFNEKGIRVFLNCLNRGMSMEDAQTIAEISDDLVKEALSHKNN